MSATDVGDWSTLLTDKPSINSVTVNNLSLYVTYEVKVRTVNSVGVSVYSPTVTLYTELGLFTLDRVVLCKFTFTSVCSRSGFLDKRWCFSNDDTNIHEAVEKINSYNFKSEPNIIQKYAENVKNFLNCFMNICGSLFFKHKHFTAVAQAWFNWIIWILFSWMNGCHMYMYLIVWSTLLSYGWYWVRTLPNSDARTER